MFKLLKQLLVEGFLSGAKPYLASHPELGVPLGIFNKKDEPNQQARINAINQYGKKGNPISYRIAKLLGINKPIPSYIKLQDEHGDPVSMSDLFKDADFKRQLKLAGFSKDTGSSGGDYTGTNLALKALSQMAQKRDPKERVTIDDLEKMVDLSKNLLKNKGNVAKQTKLVVDNIGTVLDILALEDTLRKDISRTIGMSNEQLMDTIDFITEASVEMAQFNLTAFDLKETFKDITVDIGRNLYISPDVIKRAALLTKNLEGFDAGKFADAFDRIGMNLTGAMGKIDETDNTMQDIMDTGRGFGVVMKDFLGNIGDELKLINTFGFQDGVEGLSRMVARGQVLGMEMGRVRGMALDFLEPEKAIDFAAQMQVIGGAVGDLTDPFKLMYMATNDMEGLQKAIVDTASAAVHFDKEKGKFSISPDQRRQLKAQAEAMGMDYQQLADTAIKAAKRAQVFDQLTAEIPDKDKELIASMAEIGKGGVAQVRIPSLDKLVDVDDLTEKQLEELRREGQTDSSIYKQQLTVAERTQQILASMDAMMRIQLKQQMKDVDVEGIIEKETLTQQFATKIPSLTGAEMEVIRGGDIEEIKKMLKAKGEDDDSIEKLLKMFKDVLKVSDFIMSDQGVVQFQEDDLLVGGTKLGESLANLGLGGDGGTAQSSIDIMKNMATGPTTDMTGGKGMVELTGTITLEGGGQTTEVDVNRFIKKLSDNSNNVQALNSVIMKASNT